MALKAKQQAQVAKAPQAQKANMRAAFERQNGLAPQVQAKGRAQQPRARRAPARKALANIPRSIHPTAYAFDGFDKRHMPIDELTAPYTTTNFLSVMEFTSSSSMNQIIVVCPRMLQRQETYVGPVTDYIAMRYDGAETLDSAIPTLDTLRSPIIDSPPLTTSPQYLSVRARLHNLSIRLECLGTNNGMYPPGSVYLGAVPTIENGSTSTGAAEALTLKQAWADDSIMVGYLRPVSAASLVGKPAILNATIAENITYKSWFDLSVPGSGTDKGSLGFSTALEPIVLYIPTAGAATTVVNYRLEIGQQWCSRHPHNVMLRSTQKQHPATSPDNWHKAVGAAKDFGEHLLQQVGGEAVEVMAGRARQVFANSLRAIAI